MASDCLALSTWVRRTYRAWPPLRGGPRILCSAGRNATRPRADPRFHRTAGECLWTRCLLPTRFMPRQPSEWNSPLASSPGYFCTMTDCHCSSSILRWCFRPGPCCGNRHGQCLEALLTIVHPGCWTANTLDVGITADITLRAAAKSPGQSSQQASESTYTSRRPRAMCPSPR